jgi:Protein of unknown function (DUF 659)/hAT family C-terminal dimerisation region
MGRTENQSRAHFNIFKKEGMAYARARCLYCNKETADNSTKLTEHLTKCIPYQDSLLASASNQLTFSKKRYIDSVTYMTEQDQKLIISAMADFIFGDGIPLSLVESKLFRNFLSLANPHIRMPSRRTLSEQLLNEKYNEAYMAVDIAIRDAPSLSLIFDAWTNVNHEPVVGFVIATPRPFFWKAVHSEDNRHTADYFVEQCSSIIDHFGAQKFTAIVTDNTSTMIKSWRMLEVKYPGIVCLGCLAHVINLLIGDIFKIPLPKGVVDKCNAVINFFNRSSLCDMIFQKKREELSISRDLVAPVSTRWASQISCLESFMINKAALQLVMLDPYISSKIDPELKQVVLTEAFFVEIAQLHGVLTPLKDLIDIVESKNSAISNVVDYYHTFWNRVIELDPSVSYKESILQYVANRWRMFYHPIMSLAMYLDPKSNMQRIPPTTINTDDVDTAMEQLIPDDDKRLRTMTQYLQYKARDGVFAPKSIWKPIDSNSVTTLCWWRANFKYAAPELYELAERVLNIPTSSAAVERTFSSYGYVHSSSRNRLTPERSEKLIFLYHNLDELSNE